jgi:hypothetical protein
MKKYFVLAFVAMMAVMNVQAQVMKVADLEKYAKERYGDKWLDAALNLSRGVTLDKNGSFTYQEVIETPGKTRAQLYVALNYWVTATFKDHQAITLNDKEAGCIIISSTIKSIVSHTGTLNKYSVSITPLIRFDIKDGKVRKLTLCRTTISWPTPVVDGSVRSIQTIKHTATQSERARTRPTTTFMTSSGRLHATIRLWQATRRNAPVPRLS